MVDAGALDERLRAALAIRALSDERGRAPRRLRQAHTRTDAGGACRRPSESCRLPACSRSAPILPTPAGSWPRSWLEENAGSPHHGSIPTAACGPGNYRRLAATTPETGDLPVAELRMSFFLDLEEARTGTGLNLPIDLVFVTGTTRSNMRFFDMMRSALYLRPGGGLLVDNVETGGP